MNINKLTGRDSQTLMQRFTSVSKALLTVTTSASIALALSSCTQDNSTNTQALSKATTEQTKTLRIAAAANLSDVLPKIIAGYKADNNLSNQNVEVTYASSGKLYAQIKAGAPYDIFLSANQSFPVKLAETQAVGKTPNDNSTYQTFTYTQGQLALYSVIKPINDLNSTSLAALLVAETDSKIAIANPELAPYGESAKAYLQTQNAYESLNSQKRLIHAENIGQAFQYAHTGSVEYGFVAQSQIMVIKATPQQFYTLAVETYPPILQDGIVISDAPIATDFAGYLLSPAGQKHFAQAGYLAVR